MREAPWHSLFRVLYRVDQISEQRSFTDGRIIPAAGKVWRRPQKRADYLLRYTRDFMIAVVEAKAASVRLEGARRRHPR